MSKQVEEEKMFKTLEQFAQHYADVIHSPPNAWGQHVSPHFGQSHFIMVAACKQWPNEQVQEAFKNAVELRARARDATT